MKKILLVFLLSLGAIGFSYRIIEVHSKEGYANVRKLPDRNSKVVEVLEDFDSARIIRKEGQWYYVKTGDNVGYIHQNQGSVVHVYEVKAKEGYANIRKSPSSKSEIIATVYNGEEMYAYGQKGEWLHIAWDASPHAPVYYIHKSQVKDAD